MQKTSDRVSMLQSVFVFYNFASSLLQAFAVNV